MIPLESDDLRPRAPLLAQLRLEAPRLWIDVIAHVEMGRDKRQYRFVQDTRYGRAVLSESHEIKDIVQAVTRYVARRLVGIEHKRAALAQNFANVTFPDGD